MPEITVPIAIVVLFVAVIAWSILAVLRSIEQPFQRREGWAKAGYFLSWCVTLIFLSVFGLVFGLLPFIVICITVNNVRAKQRGFLWMMAVAAEKNISLAAAACDYAEEVGGIFGRRVDEFAALLHQGVPLPEALGKVPLLVSRQKIPIICEAFEGGVLAKGLRDAAAAREGRQELWNSFFAKLVYIAAMICLGIAAFTFAMIKIIPAYEKIFHDFHRPLPEMTLNLVGFSRGFCDYWFLGLPIYLAAIVLFGYAVMKYFGMSLFELPFMVRLARRKHAAAILDSLAMTVENHRPIDAGIHTLLQTYPSTAIRGKLDAVLGEVHAGVAWGESLLRAGLIGQSDYAVLQAAERTGNLPWAMHELADSNRRRLSNRLNLVVQVAFPPVVLCFGAMVFFIFTALFYPVITLIGGR